MNKKKEIENNNDESSYSDIIEEKLNLLNEDFDESGVNEKRK